METYTDTKIISLNSLYANNKKNTSYLSDLEFYFKNILKDEPNIVRSTIQLINAQFPVSYYTINYTNNIFIVNSIPITITKGNYNSSNLITELKNQLLTVFGLTFNIIISRITGIMTFYSTSSFTFNSSNLLQILGFEKGINYTSTLAFNPLGNYSIIAPFPLNLLGIKKIKLFSNILATNSFDSFGSGNNSLIQTITVNAPPFGMIIYSQPTEALILKSKIIDTLDLQIYDEDNNFINFNNCNFTITLQLNVIRTRPALSNPIKTITDVLEQELIKIDTDIQTLANQGTQQTQDNSTQDLGNSIPNYDNFDPTNTLDFLQYSGQI